MRYRKRYRHANLHATLCKSNYETRKHLNHIHTTLKNWRVLIFLFIVRRRAWKFLWRVELVLKGIFNFACQREQKQKYRGPYRRMSCVIQKE